MRAAPGGRGSRALGGWVLCPRGRDDGELLGVRSAPGVPSSHRRLVASYFFVLGACFASGLDVEDSGESQSEGLSTGRCAGGVPLDLPEGRKIIPVPAPLGRQSWPLKPGLPPSSAFLCHPGVLFSLVPFSGWHLPGWPLTGAILRAGPALDLIPGLWNLAQCRACRSSVSGLQKKWRALLNL